MPVNPAGSPGAAAVVLLAALLIGVGAGRAAKRWSLLLVGMVALAVLALVAVAVTATPGTGPAAQVTALYAAGLPLLVVFVAGWLCGRGTWFRRFLVIGSAALLLAAFPYDAAGRATADTLLGDGGSQEGAEGLRQA